MENIVELIKNILMVEYWLTNWKRCCDGGTTNLLMRSFQQLIESQDAYHDAINWITLEEGDSQHLLAK